jgi:hypothetical protein
LVLVKPVAKPQRNFEALRLATVIIAQQLGGQPVFFAKRRMIVAIYRFWVWHLLKHA